MALHISPELERLAEREIASDVSNLWTTLFAAAFLPEMARPTLRSSKDIKMPRLGRSIS